MSMNHEKQNNENIFYFQLRYVAMIYLFLRYDFNTYFLRNLAHTS